MARILIVDDEELNRTLMATQLEAEGYQVVMAAGGEEAVACVLAADQPIDLVLLDILMPGRDGYWTAAALKQAAGARFVPIILVTALSEHAARLHGLEVGADEFLTKPVDRTELLLRVSTLLQLRAKETALTHHHEHLVALERFRDDMSALVVHDLKNPLSVLRLNVSFVLGELRRRPDMQADLLGALDDCQAASGRIARLIANLLDVSRLEERRLTLQTLPINVAELLAPLIRERATIARQRAITVLLREDSALVIHADRDLVTRVLENVLDNALRHTPRGGRIEIFAQLDGTTTELCVGNSGNAIPLEARSRIFDKFGRATETVGRMNLGLGLYFCRLVAEAHGGSLGVKETPSLPVVFSLSLPVPS